MKKNLTIALLFVILLNYSQNPAELDNNFDFTVNNFQGSSYSTNGLIKDGNKYLYITSFNSGYKIARINNDGSIDNTFNMTSSFNSTLVSIGIQSNGKYIIGIYGSNPTYNGTSVNHIVRLNNDGTFDTSFNCSSCTVNMQTLLVQPDDKILFGGYGKNNSFGRLLPNGSIDTSFNVGTGISANNPQQNNVKITSIKLYPNNKILIGGAYEKYNDFTSGGLTLLNDNGSIDNNFNNGGLGFNYDWEIVRDIEIYDNDKIIVAGNFTSYNNSSVNRIIKLNSDGTKDTSFNTNINNQVNDLIINNDNKVYVSGFFTIINGSTHNRFAKLNTDGTIDNSFNTQSGFNNVVRTIMLDDDNNIIIAGLFSDYSNSTVNRIVKVYGNSTLSNIENQLNDFTIYPNPVNVLIKVVIDDSFNFKIYSLTGRVILEGNKLPNESIDVNGLNKGIYILELETSSNNKYNQKFIKE